MAGTTAAVNYLADLGAEFGAPFTDQFPEFEGRRFHLKTAMAAIRIYERPLTRRLIEGLNAIPGVTLYGITDPARFDQRAPTAAFTLKGYTPRQVAERLGQKSIFVGDLRYYALAVAERLDVEESGGMVLQHSRRGGSVVGCGRGVASAVRLHPTHCEKLGTGR